MFFNSEFNIVKKSGLLVFLLMPLMVVPALALDAPATKTDLAIASASEDKQRTFSFPRWPENRQISRERIPLAPPGPYMSSALSDFSFEQPSFDRARSRHAADADSPEISMGKFSPDVPWPSQAKSPARWRPENGYRYVESPAKAMPSQAMPYNSPANYNYEYRKRPVMNWPGSTYERSNPAMNAPAY